MTPQEQTITNDAIVQAIQLLTIQLQTVQDLQEELLEKFEELDITLGYSSSE